MRELVDEETGDVAGVVGAAVASDLHSHNLRTSSPDLPPLRAQQVEAVEVLTIEDLNQAIAD